MQPRPAAYDFHFTLELADGLTIEPREKALIRNYATVGAALRGVPFAYDTGLEHCRGSYRELFADRPGGD